MKKCIVTFFIRCIKTGNIGDVRMNLLISLLDLVQNGGSVETVTKAANVVSETTAEVTSKASGLFGSGSGMWGMILYIVFFIAIFYFLIIRPQKKREKQTQEMQAGIQIGDEVVTSSGFYGKVVELTEDVITIEFGTNKGIRIPVRKNEVFKAVAKNTSEEKK